MFLGGTAHASAQVRRIEGTVTDEAGQPVAGAVIDAIIVSVSDGGGLAVRNNERDESWRTSTSENGGYAIRVPMSGRYLVTASKEGLGTDRTTATLGPGNLTTANLTLFKTSSPSTIGDCGKSTSFAAVDRSGLAAAAHPGLARLLGWLEAVHLHAPGCSDPPAIEVGRWFGSQFETLLRDVRALVTFLQRAEDARAEYAGRARMQPDQLIFFIYDRRLTLDELQRTFYGNEPLRPNELLRRGAVLHADIAISVPGTLGNEPLVADGGRRGWRRGTRQWEIARQLLDSIKPNPSGDADALLWYRAVSAYLFREGNLAELTAHLDRARQVFPQNPIVLFESAYLHQELSSPAIQASVQQLRAADVNVRVGSRRDELRRAERLFREALTLSPGDADGRIRLGHTLGELGRHREAAAELQSAIDARPDTRRLYLAELFLGRAQEALKRRDEARRHYERAAVLYPRAQSPRMALSRLARQTGDIASAQRALESLAAAADLDRDDPWWSFYEPHQDDAEPLMERMRQIGK